MQETMLQEVMTAPKQIRFDTVPVPQAGPGQVLVKIKRIGICGSDIHVYHGTHPYTSYPITQGHEVSGQVAALGEGVTQFRVGQRVTIEPPGLLRGVLSLHPREIQPVRAPEGHGLPDHRHRQRVLRGGRLQGHPPCPRA